MIPGHPIGHWSLPRLLMWAWVSVFAGSTALHSQENEEEAGLVLNEQASSFAFAASRFPDPIQRFHRLSANYSVPVSDSEASSGSAEKVFLELQEDPGSLFAETFAAIGVRVVNTTDRGLGVACLNGAIDLTQEAEVAPDLWRPIEVLPESCCGLPQMTAYLEAHSAWTFVLPRYGGSNTARLRFRLTDVHGATYVSDPYLGGYQTQQLETPLEGPSAQVEELAARAFR